jgi:hypothetical protein
VYREDAPPPIATTLYRLTPRGEALNAALLELGRWGAPLMAEPADGDAYRGHWLASLYPSDQPPDEPPVTIELRTGEEAVTIETVDGTVRTRPGPAETPDLILTGPAQLLVGVLTGTLTPADAQARGLHGTIRTSPQDRCMTATPRCRQSMAMLAPTTQWSCTRTDT